MELCGCVSGDRDRARTMVHRGPRLGGGIIEYGYINDD